MIDARRHAEPAVGLGVVSIMAQTADLPGALSDQTERAKRLATTIIRDDLAAIWLNRIALELGAAISRRAETSAPTFLEIRPA